MRISNFTSPTAKIKSGSIKMEIADYWKKQEDRYEKIKKNIKSQIYNMDGYKGRIIYVEIPSSIEGFFYQVVLHLTGEAGIKSMEDYHVKIFSNSPSFVYTYAYVFYNLIDPDTNEKDLLAVQLHKKIMRADDAGNMIVYKAEEKLGEEPVSDYPSMKNPSGIPLLDYTVACALIHVVRNYKPSDISGASTRTTYDRLFDRIYDFENIMIVREKFRLKQREKQVKEKIDKIDMAPRIKKEVKRLAREGAIVRVSSNGGVHIAKSKNVNVVKATTTRLKPGIKTTRRSSK